MKESYTKNIRQGDFFCLEGYTKVEDKIHILMSGRMSVKCDGVFLHNIETLMINLGRQENLREIGQIQ